MTAPRQVVPGRTLFITRRCAQRQMLLVPRRKLNAIVRYLLAEAATRYDVTLFAWMFMGNHLHILIRDNDGNYPEFLAHLNKMIAKALNAFWKRCESFWSPHAPSVVWVVTKEDAFDKLIYILANPVAAGLVARAHEWPGVSSLANNTAQQPKPETFERPTYFRKNGKMPASATLKVERLAGFESLSAAQWVKKVHDAVRVLEDAERNRRRAEGKKVLGVQAILATSPTSTPQKTERKKELSPHLACRDVELRKRELRAILDFRIAHRAALLRLRAGEHSVVFPPGTYRVRQFGIATADTHALPAPRRKPPRARTASR